MSDNTSDNESDVRDHSSKAGSRRANSGGESRSTDHGRKPNASFLIAVFVYIALIAAIATKLIVGLFPSAPTIEEYQPKPEQVAIVLEGELLQANEKYRRLLIRISPTYSQSRHSEDLTRERLKLLGINPERHSAIELTVFNFQDTDIVAPAPESIRLEVGDGDDVALKDLSAASTKLDKASRFYAQVKRPQSIRGGERTSYWLLAPSDLEFKSIRKAVLRVDKEEDVILERIATSTKE